MELWLEIAEALSFVYPIFAQNTVSVMRKIFQGGNLYEKNRNGS